MSMQQPLITILLPNYNEHENVKRGVLNEMYQYLKHAKFSWEVLISDDGSSDESPAIITQFANTHHNFRFLRNSHAGKPYALRAGINEAKGDFVLLTDMDQSTPLSELEKLLPFSQKGYSVVIGSRGARRTDSSPIRQLASLIFLLVRRLILLPEIKDTQCGFKLIKTSVAKEVFEKMRLFGRKSNAVGWRVTAYDVELLHIAKKLGQKIKEVRVIWKNEDTSSGKSRNFVKESLEMFFEILRVRVNDMLGKYNV